MIITDLNIDCLERCFQHLNLKELLSIADSNKQLRYMARYIFVRKYRRQVVWLRAMKYEQHEHISFISTLNLLDICSLKWSLKFLRCFGDLALEIRIMFLDDYGVTISNGTTYALTALEEYIQRFKIQCTKSIQWEHLLIEYLNEYCSESLTEFSFDGELRKGGLNKLTKTFGKVKQISLLDLYPIEKKLYELFPNLRKLELYYSGRNEGFLHVEFIAGHFPYLEDLDIHMNGFVFDKESIAIAFCSNPQLKSIRSDVWMDIICDTKHFSNSNETYFQNLEKLHVDDELKGNKTFDGTIHLKNLKELYLDSTNIYDKLLVFPFSSNQLEKLVIRDYGENANFNNLIAKYPTVKKLILKELNQLNHSEIAERMPSLEEIYFAGCVIFTVDEIVSAIHQYHSLRLFTFRSLAEISLSKLSTYLKNVWSLSFVSCGDEKHIEITLKRQI